MYGRFGKMYNIYIKIISFHSKKSTTKTEVQEIICKRIQSNSENSEL
jgi:hypothetical protein